MPAQPASYPQNVVGVYPDNPHYLMYQGRPVLLITSAEHYGAVVNQDFDYRAYFETLAKYGLNYTRIYPGAYVEVEGMFIENNTLAPKTGRHLVPWARSSEKGAWDGGNKYDLDTWSEDYFHRLRDFIREAARYDIVVEICFFNCQYKESWHACPLNAANNIQEIGPGEFNDFQTMKYPDLVAELDGYVGEIVRQVNEFDNVILEICDEPTLKGTPAPLAVEWIDHLIQVVVETEADLPKKHLVAQQVMMGVDFTRDARVPLMTTQYIWQNAEQIGGVEALDTLYSLGKPIELNETAYYPIWYKGDIQAASRAEAWEFIVGGGAAFNHLNGRFTVLDPRGDTPDNHQVLTALAGLQTFMSGFDFTKMAKDSRFLVAGLGEGTLARGMSQPGKQYALYIHHSRREDNGGFYVANPGSYQEELAIELPAGAYVARWVDPANNQVIEAARFEHEQGLRMLRTPPYAFDIALSIRAVAG